MNTLRHAPDGTLYLVRRDAKIIAEMDKKCTRVRGELRWFPEKIKTEGIESLRHLFTAQPCYIVGKGSSLDFLTSQHFTFSKAPVICINEAGLHVAKLSLSNPLLVIQQDAKLRNTCFVPNAIMLLNYYIRGLYEESVIWTFGELGISAANTGIAAILIARKLGATEIHLTCMDALDTGETDYAKCIGYSASLAGSPTRFLKQKRKYESALKGINYYFITPKAPAGT